MNSTTPQQVNLKDYDVLLDVRTLPEYTQGHIKDTIRIDILEDDFLEHIQQLDKTKSYLLICRSGGRSARACELMEELGFKQITNLEGGMIEWKESNLPFEKN